MVCACVCVRAHKPLAWACGAAAAHPAVLMLLLLLPLLLMLLPPGATPLAPQEAAEAAERRGDPLPDPETRFDSNCITPGTREWPGGAARILACVPVCLLTCVLVCLLCLLPLWVEVVACVHACLPLWVGARLGCRCSMHTPGARCMRVCPRPRAHMLHPYRPSLPLCYCSAQPSWHALGSHIQFFIHSATSATLTASRLPTPRCCCY